MKYRVKTGLLKNLAVNDTVECRNGLCECFGSGYTFGKGIIERNPDWFQNLQEIEVGQYWRTQHNEIVRVQPRLSEPCKLSKINTDKNVDLRRPKKVLAYEGTLLSDNQVQQALIEEFNRRYSRDETIWDARYGRNKYKIEDLSDFYYQSEKDVLCGLSHGNGTVYCEGTFAEIITDEWEIENGKFGFIVRNQNTGIYWECDSSHSKQEAEAIRNALNDMEQSC